MTSNPLRILRVLDEHLHAPFALCVYGRSGLALGYPGSAAEYHATMDVDAILPAKDLRMIESNDDFWQAQERTNQQLGDAGLYFSHLFEEHQVILTPDWLDKRVALSGFEFRHLQLSRPSTADLVLTKMMRVDPQDRDDIRFLVGQTDVTATAVREGVQAAVIPPVDEIRAAFADNRDWLYSWLH